MSHLLLGSNLSREDKCIYCGWSIRPYPPLGWVPNTFLPVESLEFSISPILILLFYDLKNHTIIGSALPVHIFGGVK
jgi:hypothetical protein